MLTDYGLIPQDLRRELKFGQAPLGLSTVWGVTARQDPSCLRTAARYSALARTKIQSQNWQAARWSPEEQWVGDSSADWQNT